MIQNDEKKYRRARFSFNKNKVGVKKRKTKKCKSIKRKGGENQKCKTECKNKFLEEIKKDKRYKVIQKIASFFTKEDVLENEAKSVLDDKDTQSNEVFKDCVDECERSKK